MQEAVDRLSTIKQKENQLEFLQSENARLHELEANFEDVQVIRLVRAPGPLNQLLLIISFVSLIILFHP